MFQKINASAFLYKDGMPESSINFFFLIMSRTLFCTQDLAPLVLTQVGSQRFGIISDLHVYIAVSVQQCHNSILQKVVYRTLHEREWFSAKTLYLVPLVLCVHPGLY